jgi:hypothetical protein
MIVFCLALYTLKVRGGQRLALTILLLPSVVAIIGSDRRTAYPVFIAALIFFVVVQSGEVQKRVLQVAWKFAIVFVVYLAVFWNSRGDAIWLTPVRSIREGISSDEAQAGDSYVSNLYRVVENYDLARMAWEKPLLGSGYGTKVNYYVPIPLLWDLGFYIAHNQILSVPAKTGIVGFVIFLFFYLSVMSELGLALGTTVRDPYFKAVLVLVGADVTNHIVFSYFDIVLTYYRSNILLGALIGLAGAIIAINKESEQRPQAPSITKPESNVNDRVRWLLQVPSSSSSSNVSTPA